MALDWSDIEDAIRAWVVQASGLAESKVIFANQEGEAPSGTFMTIFVGDSIPYGQPMLVTWEHASNEVPPPAAGQEIELQSRQVHDLSVTVSAFTPDTTGDAAARSLLSAVEAKLHLPTPRALLRAAGLVPIDVGAIRYVPAIAGTDFEGRAVLDVRFQVEQTASERVGYIEHVEVTDELSGLTYMI